MLLKKVVDYMTSAVDEESEWLLKGNNALESIINRIVLENEEHEGTDQYIDAGWLEGRLFTFSMGCKKLADLNNENVDSFILLLGRLDMFITDYFNDKGDESFYKSDEFTVNDTLEPGEHSHHRDWVMFSCKWKDYLYSVKVHLKSGYREGFIDDTYLYTKAGGLEVSDIRILIDTHFTKPEK